MSDPEIRISGRPGRPETWQEQVSVYWQLTKPRIIELLLVTTVPAMIAAQGGWPGLGLVVTTLIGGTLSAAGANVLNSVADRDIDRIMRRTRSRPLPSGRADPRPALFFGMSLGASGFLWLWATTNLLAAALSTAALLFYVFVYTMFLKRTSPQNIVVGGAAGARPHTRRLGRGDGRPLRPGLGHVRHRLSVDASTFLGPVTSLRGRLPGSGCPDAARGGRITAHPRSHFLVHRCARGRFAPSVSHRRRWDHLPRCRGWIGSMDCARCPAAPEAADNGDAVLRLVEPLPRSSVRCNRHRCPCRLRARLRRRTDR